MALISLEWYELFLYTRGPVRESMTWIKFISTTMFGLLNRPQLSMKASCCCQINYVYNVYIRYIASYM